MLRDPRKREDLIACIASVDLLDKLKYSNGV